MCGTTQHSISIEFKLLVALRILGQNNTADDSNELSSGTIGESTCANIFKNFVKNFALALYSDFVKEPQGEELTDIMEMYRLLGLSGAIGSMDCTSVSYGRCSASLKWPCIGKDGYPTLSF